MLCLCTLQYFAPATSYSTNVRLIIGIHTDTAKFVQCTCTVHTVIVKTFAHTVFVSLLLHCNFRSVQYSEYTSNVVVLYTISI